MPARRTNAPRLQSPVEQHAEWLGLLRPEGPFLALPVLTAALPQGLDTVPDATRARIRQAWAEVSAAPDLLGPAWQELIIGELLRYPASALRGDVALPGDAAQGGVRPDVVACRPDSVTRLHVYRRGFDEPLTGAAHGQPALAERAAQLCRDTRVPLALLTNGRFWVLVHARPGEATSTAVFDADLWLEEPTLLRAFASLCCASRVLPSPASADGAPSASLAGLFARSADEHAHPPFIGGQRLTGAIGKDVREYLVEHLSRGKRGSADLCSYFLLRNLDISRRSRVGIIATNTIAQGDTREVGLDQAGGNGVSVYRAVKSQPWPGTASLEVSLLWVGHASDDEPRTLDGRQVPAITPSLDPRSRASGNPHRLAANADQSFQGSNILGLGFTMPPDAAQELISKNPRDRDVLFRISSGMT